MPSTAALYGFEFTRSFSAGGLSFAPIETQHPTSRELARNLLVHNLTGTVSAPLLSPMKRFHLEGVLSFIEHLEVLVSEPVDNVHAVEAPDRYFEVKSALRPRHNGGGAVIGSDALSPQQDSRRQFIELALGHLDDTAFCERTRFHSLLFKCVETFRQRQPFLEISYFLLISGLEAFSRAVQNDYKTRNAAEPISRALEGYGFKVYENNPNDLPRSISTYLHIRNALFHQGDYSAKVQMDQSQVILDCSEYLFHLSMLVSLTVMKAIGFDDDHTNWDCWIDRQLLR